MANNTEGMKTMSHYVACAVCGRIMKSRTPVGGDGSVSFPYPHKAIGEKCDGTYQEGILLTDQETANFIE